MPVTLANTGDSRTVRINADDGFVTIACNRTEGTMTISKSTRSAAIPTVTAAR